MITNTLQIEVKSIAEENLKLCIDNVCPQSHQVIPGVIRENNAKMYSGVTDEKSGLGKYEKQFPQSYLNLM